MQTQTHQHNFNIVTLAMAAQSAVLKEVPRQYALGWPTLVCKDGFRMSVQAGARHFSTPQVDNASYYTHVELSCLSEECLALAFYGDLDGDIFEDVPVQVVEAILKSHGGLDLPATVAYKKRLLN